MPHDAPRDEARLSRNEPDTLYADAHVRLDTDALHVARGRGRWRRIAYREIHAVTSFRLGALAGRYRVVGLGFARPRNWFYWDTGRRHKTTAIALDMGRWLQPTITPDDPQAVLSILHGRLSPSATAHPRNHT